MGLANFFVSAIMCLQYSLYLARWSNVFEKSFTYQVLITEIFLAYPSFTVLPAPTPHTRSACESCITPFDKYDNSL